MGTSAKNTGPGATSPLIPTWLEPGGDSEPTGKGEPSGDGAPETPSAPATEGPNTDMLPSAPDLPQLPALPPEADSNRFRSARTHFNKFARSSGTGASLGRAVAEYVRKGYGGARGASARMAHSARTAGNIIGFAQTVRQQGFDAAAKQFGLQGLIGKPIGEASAFLIDAFTGPAITTDENISRDAWCEAVKELIEDGVTDFEDLSPDQWAQAVEVFLCKSIELRIFNEIGVEVVGIAASVARLDQIHNDLTSLIRGHVQNTIVPLLQDGKSRTSEELNRYVAEVVDRAFDYLQELEGGAD